MIKKVNLVIGIAGIIGVFGFALSALAQSSLPTSANLPVGKVTPTTTPVDSKGTDNPLDDVFGASVKDGPLNFGDLEGKKTPAGTELGIFLPKNNSYFAVDVANAGGGLQGPKITVDVSFANPISGNTLGPKASATFVKTVWVNFKGTPPNPDLGSITEDDDTITNGGKASLAGLSRGFLLTDLAAGKSGDSRRGWLRFYVGINNGTDTNPAFEPITALDPFGLYSGTIKIKVG